MLFGLPNGILDLKAEPAEVVALDNFVQPVDRGPAPVAPDPRLLRSWQYQVTGKVAMAEVLQHVKAEHIKSGERPRPLACKWEEGGGSRATAPLDHMQTHASVLRCAAARLRLVPRACMHTYICRPTSPHQHMRMVCLQPRPPAHARAQVAPPACVPRPSSTSCGTRWRTRST